MRKLSRVLVVLLFAIITTTFITRSFASSATTQTRSFDKKGNWVVTQDAYLPDRTLFDLGIDEYYEANGIEFEEGDESLGLNSPQDMYIDEDDNIFIADTGNKRIVVYDSNNNTTIDVIEFDQFRTPRGLFLSKNYELYVADSGAHAVFKLEIVEETEALEQLRIDLQAYNDQFILDSKQAAFDFFRENEYLTYITDEWLLDAIESRNFGAVEDAVEGYFTSIETTEEEYREEHGDQITDPIVGAIQSTFENDALDIPQPTVYGELEPGWYITETFTKPTSVSFQSKSFDPKKVAVDNQDNMYIVAEGLLDGIVQLSDSGEFLGFFSTNKVVLTARQRLEDLILTDRQEDLKSDRNPPTFSNIFVDQKGIKYTTSLGDGIEPLKKHNTDGSNNIDNGIRFDLELIDLYTDDTGIIYTASSTGYIHVWTNEGGYIFSFGSYESSVDIAGLYKDLVSIAVDSKGKVWTLDALNEFVQSYSPTEYSTTIYEALDLYKKGKYDDAVEKWEEVLKLNQLSVIAHNEIGKNLFSRADYEQAMFHFELSGNRYMYSQAYWEVRNIDLQRNLPAFLLGLVLVLIGYYTVKLTNRKYQYLATPVAKIKKVGEIKVINDVLYMFAFIKHPLDSFYYLKRKQKGSYLGATIIYFIFFIVYMVFVTSKGFIYQEVEAADMDLFSIVLGFFSFTGLFIICNYLVASINDGEGSVGELYRGFMYSLLPIIVGFGVVTYLSYYLTLDEVFILQFARNIGVFGSVLLVFLALQELHNYTIRNTIKSILLTFLFMIIVIVVLLFIQIMGDQLVQFLIALVKEAFRNVFN